MAKRKKQIIPEIIENINPSPLDDLMGDCYSVYAKDVIQNRAIPDVRDGLKPVQRRIIYSMCRNNHLHKFSTIKNARIVGDVMGNFHPHGDSSIYEALVRMSQEWKTNAPLIDFQGNNGSIDGDGPAAHRYTESRLSELAEELTRDYEKDTVDMMLNFDDTLYEPTVLPARFPNLYVNGASGIAVALATEIPPHNLKEMNDAVIYRIQHSNCSIEDLLDIVKGPDFPTGGSIVKSSGLEDIYRVGKGKIEVLAKCEILENDKEKSIIISEIPFGLNKKDIVCEIEKIAISGKVDGILEVRDETEMHGVRIVVTIKQACDAQLILKYLYNETPLKSNYSANMVAIVDGRPKNLTLIDYLDSYISFQEEVILRRSKFILAKDMARIHIINGLVKATSIMDKVVATIKSSENKADAKVKISKEFGFSDEQAEAIVMLQLYKLTHTDVTKLLDEKTLLDKEILFLNEVLINKKKLDSVIIGDLKSISSKYAVERRSLIVEDIEDHSVNERDLIVNEEVYIAVTKDGYIKRSSIKSFNSSNTVYPGVKKSDQLVMADTANTVDYLIAFTNKGNYLFIPCYQILEGKWKDEGKHINYLVHLPFDEAIIKAFIVESFDVAAYFVSISRNGLIKRTALNSLLATRYSKPIGFMKLSKNDEMVDVCLTNGNSNVFIVARDGRSSYYNENELAVTGLKSIGVKSMNKVTHENGLCKILSFEEDERCKILTITDKGFNKITDSGNFEITQRLGKLNPIVKSFKSDPHHVVYVAKVMKNTENIDFVAVNENGDNVEFSINDFHITPSERYAKKNINIELDVILKLFFISKVDHIAKDMKTFNINQNKPIKKENEVENVDHEQISIFDLNDD